MAENLIECPYCQAEWPVPEDRAWQTCEGCGRELHIASQQAFARGRDHFLAGQEAWAAALDRKRKPAYGPQAEWAIRAMQQAHSALSEALRFRLADEQREYAVEMMAEICRLFNERGMISPLEASYWMRVTVEQNSLRECDELRAKLADPAHRSLLWLPQRLHWRLRFFQLTRALKRLDRQLQALEQAICFVDPPHARRAC